METPKKVSVNFEPDVHASFQRWMRANPLTIMSKVINQALREWLARQGKKSEKESGS